MTVNLAYASTTGGYLRSTDPDYTACRNGASLSAFDADSSCAWGQSLTAGAAYWWYETFESFAFSVSATELVVSSYVQVVANSAFNPSFSRALQWYEYDWGSSLTTADWRNFAWWGTGTLMATNTNMQMFSSNVVTAGTDTLTSRIQAGSSPLRLVTATDRQINGYMPSIQEDGSYKAAETSGTSNDPTLVWLTVPTSTLNFASGASVRLSDGTWAYLTVSADLTTITLRHRTDATTTVDIGTLPLGTSATDFFKAPTLQGFALVRDNADNLYVLGPNGAATGSLSARAYTKGSGYTWTSGTLRTAAMPAYYAGGINNVSGAWHNAGTSGTIMAVAAHAHGRWNETPTSDVAYALINCQYLLTGTGSLFRNSGSAIGTLVPNYVTGTRATLPANICGSGLDVQAPPNAGTRGYLMCWGSDYIPGENGFHYSGRYVLASDGASISSALLSEDAYAWSYKDANAKMRVIAISDTQWAVITADQDSGYGITATVLQNVGTSSTVSRLGVITLDGVTATMPAAGTICATTKWDAVYDTAENKIWIYHVDTADARRLVRTSVDLNTYLAVADTVEVDAALGTSASSVCLSITAEHNARAGNAYVLVHCSILTGSTYSTDTIVDAFNQGPTAPTLTIEGNFDATCANRFDWTFNDPNVGATQSAFQVDIDTSAGTSAYDTGKTVGTSAYYTLAGSTLANGGAYRWRVRCWDEFDAEGSWSDYLPFSCSAGGNVTVTDPAGDDPAGLITDDYTIEWSVTGTTQASYRVAVTRVDTGATLVNTGWVTSTATSYTVSGMASGVRYQVAVTVRNGALVESGTGYRYLTPAYSSPEAPTVTVTAYDTAGYSLVSVTNPDPGTVELGTSADGFEAGVAGYTATGCTIAQTSAHAYAGSYSAMLTTVGTPTNAYARQTDDNAVAITAGVRYTVSYRAYSTSGYAALADAIDWYDDGLGYLDTSYGVVALSASSWASRSLTAEAPSGAAYAKCGPTLGSSPASGTILYIDELLLALTSDKPIPSGNQIHRRRADLVGDIVQLADETEVGEGGVFRDYTARSGIAYEYRARAVATTGYTDSAWSDGELNIQGVWIHDPLDPDSTIEQYLYGRSARSGAIDVPSTELLFAGRRYPVTEFGARQDDTWSVRVIVPFDASWSSTVESLEDFVAARRTLVFRDNRGRSAYVTLSGLRATDRDEGTEMSFTATRVDYTETTVEA